MKISGFQKLSLVDYDGHITATIFVSGCNFACPFCHNAGLVKNLEPEIDSEDVLSYLKKRFGLIDGVCISGGEPTLYNDLPDFIKTIKNWNCLIKIYIKINAELKFLFLLFLLFFVHLQSLIHYNYFYYF